MNALTQPIVAGQTLAKSQHDLHNARSVLDATLRFVRQQAQATDDPYVISRFGDLHIRIEVAAALLERAEDFLNSVDDDTEISVAIAESHLASADALNAVSNAEFELSGQRTVLPGSLHDPLRWKLQLIGNFRLNGIHPPSFRSAV
ncbi:acyl-CoA dehydrogenase [Pseudomonas brassicacearum]|jgi:alkylation response protein AidB-like acyl-CoA dehydrogenase|uniref:Acyl-CoA dehydrogenase n=1 Tax=Pseudomonas brassicacearum TaxID=930166 RepID=A0A423JEM0_9PSED|nr:acyl-CoA dehydrogenase [Pseudomonas brassicacearum]RON36147.1 acyl-CoA dehydrogenase [Pseudomonas brassicacearum]